MLLLGMKGQILEGAQNIEEAKKQELAIERADAELREQ